DHVFHRGQASLITNELVTIEASAGLCEIGHWFLFLSRRYRRAARCLLGSLSVPFRRQLLEKDEWGFFAAPPGLRAEGCQSRPLERRRTSPSPYPRSRSRCRRAPRPAAIPPRTRRSRRRGRRSAGRASRAR